jgi:hypothetical protein
MKPDKPLIYSFFSSVNSTEKPDTNVNYYAFWNNFKKMNEFLKMNLSSLIGFPFIWDNDMRSIR